MTDICKCKGTDCPLKENCYRFTAKSDDVYQSYFVDPPIKDSKCDMYWGETQKEILNQLKNIVNGIQM
jgi:hypothetical protein